MSLFNEISKYEADMEESGMSFIPSWLGLIEPYFITMNMFGTINDKQS